MGFSTGRKPWKSEPYQEVPDELKLARGKIFYFGVLIIFLFAILSVQLARIQLVNGDKYRLRAETNRLREVPLIPQRGLIFDRNGIALVENRPTFSAAVVAADLPEGRQTEITITLQEMTGVPAGDIVAKLEERRLSNDPFSPVVFKDNLTQETAFTIQERLSSLPGVRVVVTPKRQYTSPLLSHILGFVRAVDSDEYEVLQAQGYQLSDQIGKAGVELTYESVLRGTPGVRDVEADASGREIRVIDELPAKPGSNVVLSIDLDLQQNVERILREGMGPSKNASAIVMDVNTGEILALVSLPGFDNNIFSGEADANVVRQLNEDPGKPMLNHAISEQYAPGSTYKMITGLAALQEGVATANTQITSTGSITIANEFNPRAEPFIFRDWRSDLGTMNFYRGVAMSSDVYFYLLAGGYSQPGKPFFQGMGEDKLADWTKRFGLGQRTGIDIPGEAEGIVPDPVWKKKTIGDTWTIGDTYNMSIGQGYVAATPIQMAVVTAAVANGGKVLVPHVVKELRNGEGQTVATVPTNVRRDLNIDPRNMAVMREGMRQAVADGSANLAAARNVQVAGKTGTAEFGETIGNNRYREHGWFTGYAPFDKPEIAITVFLEQGTGGGNAAPVASRILTYLFGRNQRTAGP